MKYSTTYRGGPNEGHYEYQDGQRRSRESALATSPVSFWLKLGDQFRSAPPMDDILQCECAVLSVLDESAYAQYELTDRQELDGEIHCTVMFIPAFC
jgi:hypothetical protein